MAYVALLFAAMAASWVSRINLRGILWIALMQVVFWLGVLYWDFALPLPFMIAAVADSLIVYALFKYGKEKWEEWLMFIFISSILANFAGQFFSISFENFNIYAYSWTLYVLNWAAIILIGTISGMMEGKYDRDYIAFNNWSTVFGVPRSVYTKEV